MAGVVQCPLDALQLFFLNVEFGLGELVQRASVVPVAVTDDDLGDLIRLNAKLTNLLRQR